MSVVSHEPERHAAVDLRRWAGLAPPKSAPIRAALARCFLRRVATQTGIRVEFPDGSSFRTRRWSGHGGARSRAVLCTAGCGRQDRLRRVLHGPANGTPIDLVERARSARPPGRLPRPASVSRSSGVGTKPASQAPKTMTVLGQRAISPGTTTFRTICSRSFWTSR